MRAKARLRCLAWLDLALLHFLRPLDKNKNKKTIKGNNNSNSVALDRKHNCGFINSKMRLRDERDARVLRSHDYLANQKFFFPFSLNYTLIPKWTKTNSSAKH